MNVEFDEGYVEFGFSVYDVNVGVEVEVEVGVDGVVVDCCD